MELKGRFSVEWLSQSSQDSHSTSGTASESLPGFYRRPDTPELSHAGAARTHSHETGFSSTEEEETSGYESEGGRSLSPGAPAPPSASPPAGRRPRTAFTTEQIGSLERAFKRSAYLGAQDKTELCRRLNLSDKQIRNWFQNRRMKLKRTVQDSLAHVCQAKAASHLLHYSELQGFRSAPYPSFYPTLQDRSGFPYGPAPALPMDALFQYGLPVGPSYPPYPPFYSSQRI